MDYDFTELTDDQLEDQLHVVDDRRIWVIAEALRRGVAMTKFMKSQRLISGLLIRLLLSLKWKIHLRMNL